MNSFWRILLWPYRAIRAAFYLLDGSDGSNLDNSGLFDHTTDNEPIYFKQDTDTTTAWGTGTTWCYGGSTIHWPPTTGQPPDIQNKPKSLEIPDLDTPIRVINLD
ncbi:MAG: hypothetical protein WC919_00110 [Candidatus Paceibacterota bacterium]